MSITNELDLAIKSAETQRAEGGYRIDDRVKCTYMTNEEWEQLLVSMSPQTLAEFGKGGELSEKNGRPPKMASYGSSARLLYLLSRHKEGFHYEKKLPTTVGGVATTDGFCEEAHRCIFVEAKCHEPYAALSGRVSMAYRKLYEYINDCMQGSLWIEMTPSERERYMDIVCYADGERVEYFDLKQMICHLLGIATGMLRGTLPRKQTDFIYLLYDPTELPLAQEVREQIEAVYERICYEGNLIDFATLLRVIFAFLKEERYGDVMSDDEIDDMILRFTFAMASQEFYPLLLQ